jgi:hypothetical protein
MMNKKSMTDHLEEGSQPADPKADLDVAQSAPGFDEAE